MMYGHEPIAIDFLSIAVEKAPHLLIAEVSAFDHGLVVPTGRVGRGNNKTLINHRCQLWWVPTSGCNHQGEKEKGLFLFMLLSGSISATKTRDAGQTKQKIDELRRD
ncbi:hypothetical protein OUZ56_008940 [Daphnia magna]|uniref:Uncharacterized protein n=1 Tax=Daphnia magna TaxID=35525 RepID=A0ABR0AEH9_9CRUS|nr:hypothetical protein OUZ56_008940 [Daphnia magna]